jgi:hypothetical protein
MSGERPAAGTRVILGVVLLLFVVSAAFSAQRKDVSQGFDELAHLSYVASVQRSGKTWPALDTLRMLDSKTFRFTGEANYLNHPPLFYALLARLGPTIKNHPDAILVHRFLNILLGAIGLAAAMAIGLVAGLDRLRLYAYCVPLACIPVLAPLAGAVNPDNAAFAGGAIATLATWQLIASGRTMWLLAALAGVIVASWAKLTGLLLAGGLMAGVLAYLFCCGRWRREWILLVAVATLLALGPYALFIAQYGSPTPNTPAQIALLESGALETGWADAARLSFPAYAVNFLSAFMADWMPALTSRSALNYAALVFPLGAVFCGLAGFCVSLRRIARREETAIDVVTVAGILTIVATLACHIVFSYGRHLATGWMMDAYPRYYLPLAAVIPLAGLSLLSAVEHLRWRAALTAFLIAGPLVFRLLAAPLGS